MIEKKKETLLGSFKEEDNFYDGMTRIQEMKDMGLHFEAGPSRFTTFPNHAQIKKLIAKDKNCKRGCETSTSTVGCVPVHLMATLLNDLKPDARFRRIVDLAQEIGRPTFEKESPGQRGVCFMVHWEEREGWKEGDKLITRWREELTQDWCVMNTVHQIFSPVAEKQINYFGNSVLKALGFKRVNKNARSLAPGVVCTENSFAQAAHIDFDETKKRAVEKSWILHTPLQKEGLLLSAWDLPIIDENRDENAKHNYIFVPFGSYICLRSDVLHSGVCGSTGNTRFHMLLKSKNEVQVGSAEKEKDSPLCFPDKTDELRPDWEPAFQKLKREFAMHASKHTDQLEEHTGRCHALDGLLDCIHWKGEGKKRKRKHK